MDAISGVMAAAVTPRRAESAQIDLGAALDLMDFLSNSGVAGIALLSTTGEFVHFDLEDRLRLISLAIRRSRVPVLVNVSHSCLEGALRLAQEAIDGGAAGLLLMPPFFYRYEEAELEAYFRAFAEEAASTVPLLLYDIPFFVSPIPAALSLRLIEGGVFAGIMDSSGDLACLDLLLELRRRHPFCLMAGNDLIFSKSKRGGASGLISGVACAVPELLLGLERAISASDLALEERLEGRLVEFIEGLDGFPSPAGIREALAARGLKTGPHAIEFSGKLAEGLAGFREWFSGWLPEVLKEIPHA